MVRISITTEAFDAVASAIPFGSMGYGAELNSKGGASSDAEDKRHTEARAAAIRSSSEQLNAIASPSLTFSISSATLEPMIAGAVKATDKSLPVALDNIRVHTGSQEIGFTADVSGTLDAYRTTIKGSAEGGVSVATTGQGILLTPNLEQVHVSSIAVSGWHLPGAVSAAVGSEITKFISNVNGRIKPIPVDFGSRLTSSQTLSPGDREVTLPALSMTASSVLVDSDRVVLLAQINGDKAQDAAPATEDFDAFKASFVAKANLLLARMPKDGLSFSPDFLKTAFAGLATPMTPQERANASLAAAWQGVHRLAGPDISLILPAADIDAFIAPMMQKALTDAAAKANVVLSDSRFVLADGRLGVTTTASADLEKPLAGKVTFRVGISGSPVSDKANISLLPTLDEFEVVKFETAKLDPADLVTGVNAVLSGLVQGVTQILPSIPIDLRPVEIPAVDLKKAAEKAPGLALQPAVIPATEASLDGAAILIASEGIEILADANITSPSLAARPAPANPRPSRAASKTSSGPSTISARANSGMSPPTRRRSTYPGAGSPRS